MIPIQMLTIKGLIILIIIAWAISSSTLITFYTAVLWCGLMWYYKSIRPNRDVEFFLVVVVTFALLLWWYSLF